MKSVKTSPHRCPLCSEFAKDCTAMMPPCTTLDHTVNQMRLKCASGPSSWSRCDAGHCAIGTIIKHAPSAPSMGVRLSNSAAVHLRSSLDE